MNQDKKTGLMFVFFTALVSGVAIFINQFGVSGINSNIFTFAKNTVVVVFLFAIIMFLGEFKALMALRKKDWMKLVLIGFVGGSVPFLLFFRGLQLSSGAASAFIHKTMFIYAAIMAMVFLKERLNKKILISAVLLLAGSFLILNMNPLSLFSLDYGSLLVFIATLFWAAENVISKHTLKELSSRQVAFGRMFFGSLFILAFLFFNNELGLISTLTLSQMSWILVSSIFLFLYVFTWYAGLKDVKVSVATSILLLGSPITTLLSYFFLGAVLTVHHVLGILFLVSGIISFVFFTERIKETQPIISTANP
ncbi:EamA family transporter [Candidatus Woesearchaeota archaeon]|nr:EamA family transporter [Candidatus Woesearchaeota archaeon]